MKTEKEICRAITLLKHHAKKVGAMQPEFKVQTMFAVIALEWAIDGADGQVIQKMLDDIEQIKSHFNPLKN